MSSPAVISLVLGVGWAFAAVDSLRSKRSLALMCGLLAAAHFAAACWAPLAPLVLAAWFGYACALPDGQVWVGVRRVLIAVATTGATVWTAFVAGANGSANESAFITGALAVCATGSALVLLRCRKANDEQRRTLQWLGSGAVLVAGLSVAYVALHVMIGSPHPLTSWLASSFLLIPIGQLLALRVPGSRAPAAALVQSIAIAGIATLVALVYLVIVVGINGTPKGHERGVLVAGLVAAIVVAVLALPMRARLVARASVLVSDRTRSTEEVVKTFAAKMSRAVPMDELLLQLVESLRATVAGAGAEIWTGPDGVLTRTVSHPDVGHARLVLGAREQVVIAQTRIGGPGWATVWLPSLLRPQDGDSRIVPIAHLGELLGLVVVRRSPDAPAFTEEDDRPLVELARQLGLALHNVRLDSALQASLAELAERNEELQASRLRIVAAADASRRAIERNLHDGAQQHLVALAVKLGLVRQIAEAGETESALNLLTELRGDVQTTISELRELAHGIYPPLLRDRGLGEALRTAATRSTLPCTVDVDLPARFPEDVETAAYFCCLEAMQNAGKYAGEGAAIAVRVRSEPAGLCLDLVDDGVGFDATASAAGHGFMNMRDRLGAIGGELNVESAPGKGTAVRVRIPTAVVPAIRQ
jgi:signal transduction histidine kinase